MPPTPLRESNSSAVSRPAPLRPRLPHCFGPAVRPCSRSSRSRDPDGLGFRSEDRGFWPDGRGFEPAPRDPDGRPPEPLRDGPPRRPEPPLPDPPEPAGRRLEERSSAMARPYPAPATGDPSAPPVTRQNAKRTPPKRGPLQSKSGGDLLSQGESTQVPSALSGLTSVFGMGTGVTQTR